MPFPDSPVTPDLSPDVAHVASETSVAARSTGWLSYAFSLLTGLLYAAIVPGVGWWYLAPVAFVPLAWAIRSEGWRRAAWLGWLAGFVSVLLGFTWVSHMLQEFAGLPAAVAWVGVVLLAAAQGAGMGLAAAVTALVGRRLSWGWAASLACGLVTADFVFPMIFPFNVGHGLHSATWLVQSADIWGVLGLTALVGAVNGALVDGLEFRRGQRSLPRRTLVMVGGLVAGVILYGVVRTHHIDAQQAQAEKLTVGLVQVNVGGFENTRGGLSTLQRYRLGTAELHDKGAQLVVWPEGALRASVAVGDNIRDRVLQGLDQPVLFGATRVERDAQGRRMPFNSAFVADAAGNVLGSYDKTELLVLGEYLPLGDMFPQLYDWVPNASHWGRGRSIAPLQWGGWSLGTYICYEDILPRFVQRIMAVHGDRRPDLMVNITNDSWYGDTREPMQHLALASFRAVEHRRALVRSTNTGISALVDPVGRIVARTGQRTEEVLLGAVPRMSGSTAYQWLGDIVGWVALAVVGWALWRGMRRSDVSSSASVVD